MNGTPRANLATRTATATSVAAAAALAVGVTAMSVSVGLWAAAPLLRQQGFHIAAVAGGGAAVEERAPGSYYPYIYRLEDIAPDGRRFFHIKSSAILALKPSGNAYVMSGWAVPSSPETKQDEDAFLLMTNGSQNSLPDEFAGRWFRFFDVSNGGSDIAYDVLETTDTAGTPDGFLLVGQALGPNGSDAFVLKTDPLGNLDPGWPQNPRVFGTSGDEEIAFAAAATGNGYLVAGTLVNLKTRDHEAWWIQLDRNGNPAGELTRWGTPDADEKIFALDRVLNDAQSLDGFILAGERKTKPSPGQAPVSDVLLVRLDPDGRYVWDKTFGNPLHHESAAKIRQTFSRRGETPDGFIIAGHFISQFDGIGQALAIRTDRNGNPTVFPQGQLTFGSAHDDTFSDVQQVFAGDGAPNGYVFAGTSGANAAGADDFNVYLVRLQTAGEELWQYAYAPSGDLRIDEGNALALLENHRFGFRYAVAGKTNTLALVRDGTVGQLLLFGPGGFRRADANGDERLNLTDAVFTLNALFKGGQEWPCEDAADANDDAKINLTDAVFTLHYLFQSGPVPPDPGPEVAGPDPTLDDPYGCITYPAR